jgi:hypothetical protein
MEITMKVSRLLAIASMAFSAYSLFFVFNGQFFFAASAIVCALFLEIIAHIEA